jgi:hypothetical protein
MTGTPDAYQERVSYTALQQLLSVKGEGDEWDFKETLGTGTEARVNVAKDALAFCNVPGGGSLVVGVTKDYKQVGLAATEQIDTTAIRNMVEKYIDGDYVLLAAEHELVPDGESSPRRFGIVYFRRRTSQPVLAAIPGNLSSGSPLFRSGDILIRRGAQSIRANSGDVRRLLTSTVVSAERVSAVNELWSALVEQRRLMRGPEFLYGILAESEYADVPTKATLRLQLEALTQPQHATHVDDLQLKVNLVRPHLDDNLYEQYRRCSALVGRVQWKAIQNRDERTFQAWTVVKDGSQDDALVTLAAEILPAAEIERLWAGSQTELGTWRPLAPLFDAAEATLLASIRQVLSGLA